MTSQNNSRRPVAARKLSIINKVAKWLALHNISPNQISQASVVFALIAAILWSASIYTEMSKIAVLILGAIFVQLRLICNLIDGLVAIEYNKQDATGAFWNEFPDRISDIFIIYGFGFASDQLIICGFIATLSVLTAYIRHFGESLGQEGNFSGPLDKQWRMHSFCALAILYGIAPSLVPLALWVVVGLLLITNFRRARIVYKNIS